MLCGLMGFMGFEHMTLIKQRVLTSKSQCASLPASSRSTMLLLLKNWSHLWGEGECDLPRHARGQVARQLVTNLEHIAKLRGHLKGGQAAVGPRFSQF